jgi:hypothetical protein
MEETPMYDKSPKAALALFVALAVAGCGGGTEAPAPAGGGEAPATTPPATAAVDPSTIADAGSISGTINFTGTAETQPVLQMAADPFCMTAHAGEDVHAQRLVVNDNNTLRYVFVYVKGGLEGQSFVDASESVTLNQVGCMYDPHVFGVQTNQTVTVLNSDDTLHNVNAQPANNQGFNFAQAMRGQTSDQAFANAEVMIPVKCDVHPWMQAFIGVVAHPYFSVSAEDGTFTISNLAPGTYTIGAWHETLEEQEQTVTVEANGTAEVSFDFGS